ncbi:STAS domain-containing protein [Streptomyces sp. NPDC048389]|uniref:STAS domain-containing protein n=1 Tax=Streptomyces sp. NPDC048389 TaxID=3154622 RepID=UPI003454FA70
MSIAGRITPGDVPRLCEELRSLLHEHGAGGAPPDEVFCDTGGLTQVNLATVDALARLHLVARRQSSRIRLQNAGPDLLALLELVGLPELADAACREAPDPP